MLIAIPKEGNNVCPHFGHCEQFVLYEAEAKKIKAVIDNPGHTPGFLPVFLKEQGVNLVIAGGMGGRAQDLFAEQGIETIVGVSGPINEIIEKYQQGLLVSTGAVCSEHSHADHCHDQ